MDGVNGVAVLAGAVVGWAGFYRVKFLAGLGGGNPRVNRVLVVTSFAFCVALTVIGLVLVALNGIDG